MDAELMELKIPTGWAVCYNRLYDVDMEINSDGDIKNWEFFTVDLFQIVRMEVQEGAWCIGSPHILIDVGFDEGNVDGSFNLSIVINPDWETIDRFEVKTRQELKTLIEDLLNEDIFIHPFDRSPKPVDIKKEAERIRIYLDENYV